MDLRTSMPEFHDFAYGLAAASPLQRGELLRASGIATQNERLNLLLCDLITCICTENDLAID